MTEYPDSGEFIQLVLTNLLAVVVPSARLALRDTSQIICAASRRATRGPFYLDLLQNII